MNLMEVDDGWRWNIVDKGILGHVSQINTQRTSIFMFGTIKASSGECRLEYIDINILM